MKLHVTIMHVVLILLGLIIGFYFLPGLTSFSLPFKESVIIITSSFLITFIVLFIFHRGYRKGGRAWVLHTLAAITVKFLLYLILIFAIFFLSKNRSLEFILTFFVIYLSFTSYILFSFIKQLKAKNLNR